MNRPPQDKQTAAGPEELREQVERTRAELGRTVAALVAQADVKARVKDKAAEVKEEAVVRAGEVRAKAADLAHRAQDVLPPVRDTAGHVAVEARAQAARGTRAARDHRKLMLGAAVAGAVVLWWALGRGKG
ncbi:DUF3618 domain-containing protein [Streptomyces sp. NPDC006339]|uniref:DUF3618 domain-containing protein n=1 Tax=Streptomyces sp. NPDC006339 TaxID=3156755 RepID=UPI0033AB193C